MPYPYRIPSPDEMMLFSVPIVISYVYLYTTSGPTPALRPPPTPQPSS